MTLDPGQSLVRIVICLLYQAKLFPLALVESTLHAVGLLQPLQGEDEQLSVVLVGERGEGDGGRDGERSADLPPLISFFVSKSIYFEQILHMHHRNNLCPCNHNFPSYLCTHHLASFPHNYVCTLVA